MTTSDEGETAVGGGRDAGWGTAMPRPPFASSSLVLLASERKNTQHAATSSTRTTPAVHISQGTHLPSGRPKTPRARPACPWLPRQHGRRRAEGAARVVVVAREPPRKQGKQASKEGGRAPGKTKGISLASGIRQSNKNAILLGGAAGPRRASEERFFFSPAPGCSAKPKQASLLLRPRFPCFGATTTQDNGSTYCTDSPRVTLSHNKFLTSSLSL
jgi:hypothetical protein